MNSKLPDLHKLDINAVFMMASDAMLVIDTESLQITDANQASRVLYGYHPDKLITMYYPELSDDPGLAKQLIKERFSFYSNISHIKKNGSSFLSDVSYGYFTKDNKDYALLCIRIHSELKDCLDSILKNEHILLSGQLLKDKECEHAFTMGEESERLRIAKEMHDHIGQLLVSTKFSLEKCTLISNEEERIGQIQQTIDQFEHVIQEIQHISKNIARGFTKDVSINDTIGSLIKKFAKDKTIKIIHQIDKIPARLTTSARINMYRIIEELLNNTRKHSKASEVSIHISVESDVLHINIKDNGAGVNHHPPKTSFGMSVLKHRIDLMGGDIHFSSAIGRFFSTKISIPLKNCYSRRLFTS